MKYIFKLGSQVLLFFLPICCIINQSISSTSFGIPVMIYSSIIKFILNLLESPTFLKPFFVDESSYCTDIMECINLSFDNVVLKTYLEESAIQHSMLSTHMNMQLMDFNDLCWVNFVKPTPVVLTLSTAVS